MFILLKFLVHRIQQNRKWGLKMEMEMEIPFLESILDSSNLVKIEDKKQGTKNMTDEVTPISFIVQLTTINKFEQ